MSALSWDPTDFPSTSRESPSSRAEVDRWLQTLESLLSDVADEPELAEPLARVIARTKARHEAEAERTKRALSSLDSLLHDTKPPRRGKPQQISDEQADAAIRSLKAAILRVEGGDPSEP